MKYSTSRKGGGNQGILVTDVDTGERFYYDSPVEAARVYLCDQNSIRRAAQLGTVAKSRQLAGLRLEYVPLSEREKYRKEFGAA